MKIIFNVLLLDINYNLNLISDSKYKRTENDVKNKRDFTVINILILDTNRHKEMIKYIRETRGIAVENIEICAIPSTVSHASKGIDIRVLGNVTLLSVEGLKIVFGNR